MKITEKEITDKEVLDMLNCPVCLSVVNAIKLKQRECACSLYNAYDLVAGNYGIQFNSGYKSSARVLEAGLEPAQPRWPRDFKSLVSTIPPFEQPYICVF